MFDKELIGRLYQKAGILKPENLGVLSHLMGVGQVAGFTARQVVKCGVAVDVSLVENVGMLHDIGKMFDDTLWGHVDEGVRFLREQGVDEKIIRIVKKHQIWKGKITEPLSLEEKIIILADLSFKDRIMPTEERVEDIISRYSGQGIPLGEEKWLRELSQEIHQEISEIISPQVLPF